VKVRVGIHAYEQPLRLRATVAALRERSPEAEIVALADGPDRATATEIDRLTLKRSQTPIPQGAAACFNRLLGSGEADVYVFLESGALVGPGWLERLLAGLAADERHGLAGPSTNAAWNEQGCFPEARETDVTQTAALAAARFGDDTRTLAPLLSLGDFCHAVRAEVVERIGGADETYGLGPCWEMDYNARAARAGFAGVWVCGAYVWRAPFTARRSATEPKLYETSKRLYQDRLCGLRLRGRSAGYQPHCLGEACEHFAPPELIELKRPLLTAPAPVPQPAPDVPRTLRARPRPPLVSCIMPTRDRVEFALQAIRYFQRQDYQERELVIVDDGDDDLRRRLPADPRLTYLRAPAGTSIGAKRNLACEAACGSLIAHWDDDDWFGPTRLSDQVAPIAAGQADITGLICTAVLDLPEWRFWTWTPELHSRLLVQNVHGGTLLYRRDVWMRAGRYPDYSLAEDAWLLHNAVRRGARLWRLSGAGRFIYVRHGANSWKFVNGRHGDPAGWLPVRAPEVPPADRAFYEARSEKRKSTPPAGEPLVSCLMPTYGRPEMVPVAVEYFLRQDYAPAELLVIDDGPEALEGELPDDPRVRYLRLEQRRSIGAKRNLGAEAARGELLANWDDDDWYAPWRLSYQVRELESAGAQVCGLDKLLYLDPASGQGWRYTPPLAMRAWLADGTLLFKRDFWRRNPFPDTSMGIDCRLLWSGSPKRLLALERDEFFVGIMHPGNTSPKDTSHHVWTPLAGESIRALLGDDARRYLAPAECAVG
jgi:glycosyltransferase involved in cell wall biosynthesis